jgi:hypothetical protein
MSNKVLLKKSSTEEKVPLTTDLDYGEIALNYADGKIYYKTTTNSIDTYASISARATLTNKTIFGGTLSGTLTAGGRVGTNGQVLTSTGTGVKWETVSSAGGGTSTGVIKTYNILNEFSAPLLGTQIFVPAKSTTITRVQITNGETAGVDIMLGLYKNNDLITFLTLPAGSITKTITDINHLIQTNDYITVNVVSGSGKNLMMTIFDD